MISTLLKPGVKLVGKLSLTQKFFVIFILYLFPVGYITYYSLTKHTVTIKLITNEKQTLNLVNSFKPVFISLAKSRGLTNAFLNGNNQAKSSIQTERALIDQQLLKIQADPVFKQQDSSIINRLNAVVSNWQSLKSTAFNLEPNESFERHSELIFNVLNTLKLIKEHSALMVDSDASTALLIKSFVEELPLLTESIGKMRGMGAGIAAKGEFNSTTFIALSNYHQQAELIVNDIAQSLNAATTLNNKMPEISNSGKQLINRTKDYLNLTKTKLLDPDEIQIDSTQFFDNGTQVIEIVSSYINKTYTTIETALMTRESKIYYEIWLNILSSLGLIASALYLFGSFSRSLLSSITQIKDCVNAVAKGDLTQSAKIESEDEFKVIGEDVNQMIANTQSLVSKVLLATNDLVNTAETNKASSEMTHQKINLQNTEVEQVATAMNEMAATVQNVADNAKESASSAANADKLSKEGFAIVQQTIQSISLLAEELSQASTSINQLRENAQSIGTVLDVIQGIADQTNLLALNAAIEAARAGESGRGFAVVADEVRTLASKTQESTEEIRQMIDRLQESAERSVESMNQGNEKSQQTVEDAQRAGEALQEITDSVSHITTMGEQTASAASQQTSVTEEINQSVISVKNISEDTKQAANESAKNGAFLQEVAENLKVLVKRFKI